MGLLVNGQWHDQWYETKTSGGAFQREAAQLRNWVTSNGEAGPSGEAGFQAESGRYHLYVSLACPWAHRTLIFRKLKQLEAHISVSVVAPDMLDQGWSFAQQVDDPAKGSTGDALFGLDYMHQIYTRHKSDYSGRVTVPVLWDKQQNRSAPGLNRNYALLLMAPFRKPLCIRHWKKCRRYFHKSVSIL